MDPPGGLNFLCGPSRGSDFPLWPLPVDKTFCYGPSQGIWVSALALGYQRRHHGIVWIFFESISLPLKGQIMKIWVWNVSCSGLQRGTKPASSDRQAKNIEQYRMKDSRSPLCPWRKLSVHLPFQFGGYLSVCLHVYQFSEGYYIQNITTPGRRGILYICTAYKSRQEFMTVFYALGGLSREADTLPFIL